MKNLSVKVFEYINEELKELSKKIPLNEAIRNAKEVITNFQKSKEQINPIESKEQISEKTAKISCKIH